MKRPLKTCPGDHNEEAPCATCVDDDSICDLCWEAGYPDECRAICVPERAIEIETYPGEYKSYVVCTEHYDAHQRRIELELI